MAIIKCPECQNEVSDKAAACPKCGCPIKEDVHFNQKQYRDEQSIIDGRNYAEGMERYRKENLKPLFIFVAIIITIFCILSLSMLSKCSY